MYPYGSYSVPQFDYNQYGQQDLYDPNRQLSQLLQLPQWQQLERRVTQLERQNDRQEREIDQLQRRLQRVNQRLRVLEQRLHIPFTSFDGEF
jgi:predicted RNase H-like nuclease (RuvC/YqgF family)